MYVDVADGTELDEMQSIATNLALSIARSGRMESFVGIFTPQLMLGDEVQLIDNGRKEIIGTVTSIKHGIQYVVTGIGKPVVANTIGFISLN